MQNWPFTVGTLNTQRDATFIAPYWSRVNLPGFTSGDSKVRYNGYHKDFNNNANVFNKVNQDVRTFKGDNSFEATWASVITWENVQPFDTGTFGGVSIICVSYILSKYYENITSTLTTVSLYNLLLLTD
jgi:hypothetical protein